MGRHLDLTPEQTLRESCGCPVTAALASSTGVAAIGAGVVPAMPAAIAILLFPVGIATHIVGMTIAHRADAKTVIASPAWRQALSIAWWMAPIGLAGLATFPFVPSPR